MCRLASGASLTELKLPITPVKHIPTWFPGAQFKRDAAKWKPVVDEMFIGPYKEVKAAYVRHKSNHVYYVIKSYTGPTKCKTMRSDFHIRKLWWNRDKR